MTSIHGPTSSSPLWDSKSKIPEAYKFVGKNPFEAQQPVVLGKIKTKLAPYIRMAKAPFKKASRAIVARIVIPAAFAGKAVRKEQKAAKQDFIAELAKKDPAKVTTHFQQTELWTHDGAMLDGAVMMHNDDRENFENKDAEGQKWVIMVNGNFQHYESELPTLENTCHAMNANVLTFNYRGVGESTGHPTKIEDLVTDTATCVQFLLDHGVAEEDIIIHGYSIGGGIATRAASLFDEVNLINLNSYSSIGAVGKAYFPIPFANAIVVKAIRLADYELDAAASWDKVKGEKLIICHFKDKVIPKKASLYEAIKEQSSDKAAFKAEHLKIKTNMVGYNHFPVVYKTRAEMKEKIKLLNANLILDKMKEELPKKYDELELPMPKLPEQIEDLQDLEDLKDQLSALIKQDPSTEIRTYLEEKLKGLIKPKGTIQKIGGHIYLVMYDEDVNAKITGFADQVFGQV